MGVELSLRDYGVEVGEMRKDRAMLQGATQTTVSSPTGTELRQELYHNEDSKGLLPGVILSTSH